MTVQSEDGPSVRMDIADLLQLICNPFRILQSRKNDYTVNLSDFSVLSVDGADLSCNDKTGDHVPLYTAVFYPVFLSEHIQSVLRRRKLFPQFFPPCRMGEIPCSHNVNPFSSRPQIQIFRRTVLTCRPGIFRVYMQIRYVHDATFFFIYCQNRRTDHNSPRPSVLYLYRVLCHPRRWNSSVFCSYDTQEQPKHTLPARNPATGDHILH